MTNSRRLLVDPLLQTGDWSIPKSTAIETALLPGVTDAAAQAVALAAETIGTPVSAVATGTRYEIGGDVDDDTMSILATRLLANQVIERWSIGPIEPTFVDADATADTGVEMVEIDGLDDDALLALNRERGLSLDLAELHAIVDHFRAAGRAPTDVELETLAQTWSEHCAHKTFRARITDDDGKAIDAAAAPTARHDDRDRRTVPAQCLRRQRRHRVVHRRHDARRQGRDAQPSLGDRAVRRREHRRRRRDPRRDGCGAPPHRRHRHLVLRPHRPPCRRSFPTACCTRG